MTTQRIDNQAGQRIPANWHPANTPRAHLLFMPALGTPAGFYDPLARVLAQAGISTLVMEHRGIGESPLRASRATDFGFAEVIRDDIPALIHWLQEQAPELPLLLGGHSLGGHYSAIMSGRLPADIDGVVLIACGSPWIGAYRGKTGLQLRLLCMLIPIFNRLFGHYPGDRIGFGGREARTLMSDWLALARTNVYQASGLQDDLDGPIRDYAGPVLSVRLADDSHAPETGMTAVTDKFRRVEKIIIGADELGDRADHYRWARTPEAVVRHILVWLANHGRTRRLG